MDRAFHRTVPRFDRFARTIALAAILTGGTIVGAFADTAEPRREGGGPEMRAEVFAQIVASLPWRPPSTLTRVAGLARKAR